VISRQQRLNLFIDDSSNLFALTSRDRWRREERLALAVDRPTFDIFFAGS
jgi:hypothetical protein